VDDQRSVGETLCESVDFAMADVAGREADRRLTRCAYFFLFVRRGWCWWRGSVDVGLEQRERCGAVRFSCEGRKSRARGRHANIRGQQ
jgi:hypothetical protein